MLTIKYHTMFKKDFKRIKKRGYDISRLEKIVELLANEVPLPEQFKDHNLSGITAFENVTLHPIGCSFIKSTTTNSFLFCQEQVHTAIYSELNILN